MRQQQNSLLEVSQRSGHFAGITTSYERSGDFAKQNKILGKDKGNRQILYLLRQTSRIVGRGIQRNEKKASSLLSQGLFQKSTRKKQEVKMKCPKCGKRMVNYDSRSYVGFVHRLYYCTRCDQSYRTREFCSESNAFKNRISKKRKLEWLNKEQISLNKN